MGPSPSWRNRSLLLTSSLSLAKCRVRPGEGGGGAAAKTTRHDTIPSVGPIGSTITAIDEIPDHAT